MKKYKIYFNNLIINKLIIFYGKIWETFPKFSKRRMEQVFILINKENTSIIKHSKRR